MDKQNLPLYILILPLMAALSIPLLGKGRKFARIIVPLVTVAGLMLSAILLRHVRLSGPFEYLFGGWPASIGVTFVMDSFSVPMVTLIFLMASLILIYAGPSLPREIPFQRVPGYYTLVLLMLFAMTGMTLTGDLFNLYVFMETLSLTACAIVAIKGEKETLMAALKYLMLGTIGSVSILLGIALIYMVTGQLNMALNLAQIQEAWSYYPRNITLALGFMLAGFGIKAAVFPLHTWLPDAHSSAPTPSSALLSGLVVKIYLFAAMKVLYKVIGLEILRETGVLTVITYLAMGGMILGSVFAMGQKDLKRILAYSSVAQIGYILLGVGLATEAGLTAALYHVVAHAMMKTALFLSAGAVIAQTGQRDIRNLNGVGYEMPLTMLVFTVGALGMIGVPGINGFMSKWYFGLASLEAGQPWVLGVILLSSLLNAVYYLPILTTAFLKEKEGTPQFMALEKPSLFTQGPMVVIAFLCLLMGLFPQWMTELLRQGALVFLT